MFNLYHKIIYTNILYKLNLARKLNNENNKEPTLIDNNPVPTIGQHIRKQPPTEIKTMLKNPQVNKLTN